MHASVSLVYEATASLYQCNVMCLTDFNVTTSTWITWKLSREGETGMQLI